MLSNDLVVQLNGCVIRWTDDDVEIVSTTRSRINVRGSERHPVSIACAGFQSRGVVGAVLGTKTSADHRSGITSGGHGYDSDISSAP